MASKKISQLVAAARALAAMLMEVSDLTGPASKSITLTQLRSFMGWDQYIIKSADQDVTNNATVQNDSELAFAVASGEVWMVELLLLYAGNDTTGDFKLDFGLPTVTGHWSYLGDTISDTVQVSTGIRMNAATALGSQVSLGTDNALTPRVFYGKLFFRAGSAANVQVKFANASASGGRISRICAGSVLRAVKIA